MDYTKFLGKKEEAVLAYLGGSHAHGKDRRLRVEVPRPSLGFHRFEIKGRSAYAIEAVESPELDGLPRVRGHHVRGWVTVPRRHDTRERIHGLERVQLMPEEEPAPLSVLRARAWHSGDLVFESLDFDGEVEELARLRLEKLEPLGEMKGVSSSLRLAYGVALTIAVAQRMQVPVSVREAASVATSVADIGEPAAAVFVSNLAHLRAEQSERARIRALVSGRPMPQFPRQRHRDEPSLDNAHVRAEHALDVAHARMLSSRHLGTGNIEVTFELMGERFISVVDAISLHVYDSGVCLAGADELVTLESLPGVIREAIETGMLVITRR